MPIKALTCPNCKFTELKFIPAKIELTIYTYYCHECKKRTKLAKVLEYTETTEKKNNGG